MHELSIALSILEIVGREADLRGFDRVLAIHLKLGPLSGVDPGALRSAYDLAREQSSFEQTRLVIEEVPLIVRCPACRADRPAVSLQRLCCGQCGAPTPEVVSGRELDIAALEIES